MATRKIRFDLNAPQFGATLDSEFARAEAAEKYGFEGFWLIDHMMMYIMNPEPDILETTTLLSALAMRTSRIRLGTMVMCNGFRSPALLAKILCTLDHVSRGRLEIGLGAGWKEQEFQSYGYPFPPIGTRLAQLEESLQILNAMFTQDSASFQGRHYRVVDAACNPKPLQKPHPPITIGGLGEKVLMRIAAQYADRWSIVAGHRGLEHVIPIFKQHCERLGRRLESVEISEHVMMCLEANEEAVAETWKRIGQTPMASTAIKGTPPQVIEEIERRVAKGVTGFNMIFPRFSSNPKDLELFAKEVMPAFA